MTRSTGMTLKQYSRYRFFELLDLYREAKKHMATEEGRMALLALGVQLHSAKGSVPKRLWPLVNQA